MTGAGPPQTRLGTRSNSMAERRLPSIASEAGLSRYLREIRKFPLLGDNEEDMPSPLDAEALYAFAWSRAQLSRKATMRLKTGFFGVESGSAQK